MSSLVYNSFDFTEKTVIIDLFPKYHFIEMLKCSYAQGLLLLISITYVCKS